MASRLRALGAPFRVHAALVGAFLLCTAFGLHGSSVAIWSDLVPGSGVPRALLGHPKRIRADEWAVTTPAILSQAYREPGFPRRNPSVGAWDAPLVMNLPVRHWAMGFRPQHWGFFLLDLEGAYAFLWNARTLLLLSGVFALLMVLTGDRLGVALLGTLWIFLSGYVQWWYSSPAGIPEMIGSWAWALVAVHHLALSPRRWVVVASGIVLLVCAVNFTLCFYPPWQVPLAWLGLAILAGHLGPRLVHIGPVGHARLRAGIAVAIGTSVGLALAAYYRDAKPTIDAVRATVYPGARIGSGGELSLVQVFGGFFGFFMSEDSYPSSWVNVCEASNFVLLFPAALAGLVARAVRRQRVGGLETSLLLYIAMSLSWIVLGWPRTLATMTGFALGTGTRSLIGLGLASIVWCCVYLARDGETVRRSTRRSWGMTAVFLAFLVGYSLVFHRASEHFATVLQIVLVCLLGTAAFFFLLDRRTGAFAAVLLLPSAAAFGLVNPVTSGLGAITETRFFEGIRKRVESEPEARWIVYGHHTYANYFTAAGADVLNGTKFVPPLRDLRELDPAGVAVNVYNRYAHITLVPRAGPEIVFETSVLGSLYSIHIDPAHEVWHRLGVRYVVLQGARPGKALLEQASLVATLASRELAIYRFGDPSVVEQGDVDLQDRSRRPDDAEER